jgi:hypothetical protein
LGELQSWEKFVAKEFLSSHRHIDRETECVRESLRDFEEWVWKRNSATSSRAIKFSSRVKGERERERFSKLSVFQRIGEQGGRRNEFFGHRSRGEIGASSS